MTEMELRVEPYREEDERDWDRFVMNRSVNGTAFHTRNFLNYHPPDRFEDRSILLFHEDEPVCAFPACTDDGSVFSHAGSSYGGPVIANGWYRIKRLFPILRRIDDHYQGKLSMRIAPSIYGAVRNDPILFHYGRSKRIRRELAVYKPLDVSDLSESIRRNRQRTAIRKKRKESFRVETTDDGRMYRNFFDILVKNLSKHDAEPTHSRKEFLDLKNRLSDHQLLFVGKPPGGEIHSGVWVIRASDHAWHCFYIAKDYERGDYATMPATLYAVMERARDHVNYLNFGICTEDEGRVVNEGLFDFKESLGGETINRYLIE